MTPQKRMTIVEHENGRCNLIDSDGLIHKTWDKRNLCWRNANFQSRGHASAYLTKRKKRMDEVPHWKELWKAAYVNCPYKIRVHKQKMYVPVDGMPIAKFIKLRARNRIKDAYGVPCTVKWVKKDEYIVGRYTCLALLLGYTAKRPYGKDGKRYANQARVYQNHVFGTKPRKRHQQLLVKEFAGPDGTLMMRRMLKKMGLDQKYLYPTKD